ncbi:GNAT family N-acetyltransferase [Flavobacterium sp. Root420]|uniref:GNAT family N-acetyltransferase n=1 Tax=Flavobacterium sp. Root420 TaxID=1736533 RepID=UPI0006F64EF7|nr:GNAT family N-acetyltransferase [Flavobacterium sp. Root420]KQW98845.1 acetyltransferase [Flavobacterium sp. Root420]
MKNQEFNLQPEFLEDDITKLVPLEETHFNALFEIASDPLLWEQHPIKDRYKKEVFQSFFDAALDSKSGFVIVNAATNEIIGTTRFYDYKPENSSIAIGYTFLDRKYWGGSYNKSNKKLLIDYAFQHVDSIFFHIGAENFRSQKAVLKLGATKVNEMNFPPTADGILHFEYELVK